MARFDLKNEDSARPLSKAGRSISASSNRSKMLQVDVYPAFNPLYHEYFLTGLRHLYGDALRVQFTTRNFPRFGHMGFAFRFGSPVGERRIFIDARDSSAIRQDAFEWCHTFGKINVDPASIPDDARERVVSIGPQFPFRPTAGFPIVLTGLANLARSGSRIRSYASSIMLSYPTAITLPMCAGVHMKQYLKVAFQRLPLRAYAPGQSRDDYIFFSSAVWPETYPIPDDAQANRRAALARLEFIKVCKAIPGVTFEGELFMRRGYHAPGYEGITQPKSAGHRSYVEKTKASCVVFNTPSVHSCHSWKLGEYLALGKAIISLPIIRDLPAPLVHGVHVHYVDGSPDSMREAVMLIREDAAYRAKLEGSAREYHDRYLAPAVMMKRLLAIDQANASRS